MDIKVYYTKEGESISIYPEIGELLKEDEMWDCFIQNHVIKMVGSYRFANGDIWNSFPKYYQLVTNESPSSFDCDNLKTIIKVLEKLRSEGRNLFDGDNVFASERKEKEQRKVNILSLSSYIVRDYVQHGLYKKSQKKYFKAANGKYTWAKTVKKCIPIISNGNPIYLNPWRARNISENNDNISNIHAFIVGQAIEIYKKFDDRILVKEPDREYCFTATDLKHISFLLKREILNVFSDREIALFKALIAWCDLSYNYKLVGCTNCFQNVWEWVNDAVFGNQKDRSHKESGQPIYHFDGDSFYIGKGQAKPDTIYCDLKGEELYLYIYDSKYYIPTFDIEHHTIHGYPANSDIVKQIAYIKGICGSLQKCSGKIKAKNIFLLPEFNNIGREKDNETKERKELFNEIGYVVPAKFDMMVCNLLKDTNFEIEIESTKGEEDKVYLYKVCCSHLYEMYLKNKKYIPTETAQ